MLCCTDDMLVMLGCGLRELLASWLKCVQNTESVVVSAFRKVVADVDGLVV